MREHDARSPEERITALEDKLKEIRGRLWCSHCEVPFGAALSDRDIKRLILNGRIKINPLPDLEDQSILGTCKIDLHLGKEALVLDTTKVSFVDLSEPTPEKCFQKINLQEAGEIHIRPNQVIIATTLERLTLPEDIIGRLEGRSSIARKGGSVQAAPLFDAGWDGYPVLELHNIGGVSVVAHFGEAICAMSFSHLSSSTLKGYAERAGVKYRDQTTVRALI